MGRPMRKLSVGPLFFLLVIFLFSRFASAAVQDLRGRELPAQLPAKLQTKKAAVRAKTLPTKTVVKAQVKRAAKAPVKKQVVVSGLPKKLPVFKAKRVQINFEEIPSTPLEQSVVILAPALEVIQDPNTIEVAANSIEVLPQALPEKPPQAPEAPELATVERPFIEILPSEPTGELWQQDPNAVAAQPLAEDGTRVSATPLTQTEAVATAQAATVTQTDAASAEAESLALATSSATSSGLTDLEAIAATVAAASSSNASVAATASASVTSTSEVNATAPTPAPDVIESAKLSPTPTPTETEPAAIVTRIEPSSADSNSNPNKLFVRAGYLAAKYSDLSPELANGASTFGVSFARTFSDWEAKANLDFAYGRDQRVSTRNTRMSLVRLEGSYLFGNVGFLRPYVGGGGGVANVDVTSYRASENNGELILREHAQGTAFLVSPHLGLRASLSKSILFDLTAQYLVLAGGSNVSKLGGALLEASFGFAF